MPRYRGFTEVEHFVIFELLSHIYSRVCSQQVLFLVLLCPAARVSCLTQTWGDLGSVGQAWCGMGGRHGAFQLSLSARHGYGLRSHPDL